MKLFVILAVLATSVLCEERKSYKDYHGLSIETPTEDAVKLVRSFKKLGVELFHEPSTKRKCEVAVPPKVLDQVLKELRQNDIAYIKLYDDLQKLVDDQITQSRQNSRMAKFRSRKNKGRVDYSIASYFPTYREAEDWMLNLEDKFPTLARIERIGQKTNDGNDQIIIKIGSKTRRQKPVIWIDGGIHAREWASVTTVLYFATRLLLNYDSTDPDESTQALLDTYDFYLMPIFNPDGYIYSHDVDRFWRKNRRRNRYCLGVDLNRNFGHHWGESGVSFDECDQSFLGQEAFSEIETQNVRDVLLGLRGRIQFYMNIHAYGQLWFLPYAYDHSEHFPDMREHYRVAEAGAQAIYDSDYMRRTEYRIGKPGEVLYNAAGGTFDWVHAVAGAKYAYAMELSPSFFSARGLAGFEISPNKILPIAKEVFNGIKAAIEAMR